MFREKKETPAIYSKDRQYVVWHHDGERGANGYHTPEGEWSAVLVSKEFSVGKKVMTQIPGSDMSHFKAPRTNAVVKKLTDEHPDLEVNGLFLITMLFHACDLEEELSNAVKLLRDMPQPLVSEDHGNDWETLRTAFLSKQE